MVKKRYHLVTFDGKIFILYMVDYGFKIKYINNLKLFMVLMDTCHRHDTTEEAF